jgi:hypothetical protein
MMVYHYGGYGQRSDDKGRQRIPLYTLNRASAVIQSESVDTSLNL